MTEKYVQTLERSLDILEVLAHADAPLGVTEIGNRVSLHKSTVHRILQTLCHRGYVERERESDRYKLGIKIVELGIRFFNDLEIRKIAGPILGDLAKKLDEVVHLVLYDDGEVVYVDKRESSHVVSMRSKLGRRAPMHCTAVGKALLSTMTDEEIMHILDSKGMPGFTPHTITQADELLEELHQIRQTRISLEREENEIGIICIGTPVFDFSGAAIGAISLSGPSQRMNDKGTSYLGEELKKAGDLISSSLGYSFFID